MPITGTEAALATARLQAKKAVLDRWKAQNRELSTDDKAAMLREVEIADSKAILDHIRTNMQIVILPAAAGLQTTTGPGSPTGPPAAPVPLPPNSII